MTTYVADLLQDMPSAASLFDTLTDGNILRDQDRAPSKQYDVRVYSALIGNALHLLLAGLLSVHEQGDYLSVTTHTPDNWIQVATDGRNYYTREQAGSTPLRPLQALTALILVRALRQEGHASVRIAAQKLIAELSSQGLRYPYARNVLTESTRLPNVRYAVMHLTDCLTAELETQAAWSTLKNATDDVPSPGDMHDLNLATLIHPKVRQTRATPLQKLARLTRRGGVALLVGPPGTFKTETAKRAATEAGAALVIAKGAPGVEDRDFLGGVYPTADGPRWVDGPLTTAILQAATGRTVFLVDEVLRYGPEHFNVLIGALDSVSRTEATQMGLPDDVLPEGHERYYVLALPDGDRAVCPAANLTLVMTTNLGSDHLQTADRLDAALLSRIDLILDVQTPDEDVARELYFRAAGDQRVADIAFELELLTRERAASLGGLLIRGLEARKTIALIKETRALLEEGEELMVAFVQAFTDVAVPYCCPREDNGALNDAAVLNLMAGVEEVLRNA